MWNQHVGPVRHLNVKTLFAIAFGYHHELGLGEAYKKLGKTLEGTHHRGDDDAWNIAGVLCLLLQQMRDKEWNTDDNTDLH